MDNIDDGWFTLQVEDNWGRVRLMTEDGQKGIEVRGQFAKYKGVLGRIWSVPSGKHYGGNGLGSWSGDQLILITKDCSYTNVEFYSKIEVKVL